MSDPTLLVLASLADGDKHGYAMVGIFSASPTFAWGLELCTEPLPVWSSAAGFDL